MFRVILQYTLNWLNYSDLSEIKAKIDLYGNKKLKEYFSFLFPEDSYSYNYYQAMK